MHKYTFTLDRNAARTLDRASERLAIPKSQVVREALQLYGEHLGRLDDEERRRMLATFDEVVADIPDRPRDDVDAELSGIRRERREGAGQRDGGS
ncbi:MAG: ribbon-helix-helix domain-containing protein [Longimicrobiales bacterium]